MNILISIVLIFFGIMAMLTGALASDRESSKGCLSFAVGAMLGVIGLVILV